MIIFKSPEEIQRMRKAGRIVALTIERLVESVRAGMTTMDLDRLAERHDGRPRQPAFLRR